MPEWVNVSGMDGEIVQIQVTNPINEKVVANYGILKSTNTVIIEMAQASGLTLVPQNLRNPLNTTTYGVGETIKDAIQKGCRDFIIGIGGSDTNDCGVGMLSTLGILFYDENGNLIDTKKGGQVLSKIKNIDTSNKLKELDECNFKISCDVKNTLLGQNGAPHIYSKQKGATDEIINELENGVISFSNIVKNTLNKNFENIEGVGAAGGLGYAFLTFLNGKLQSGIKIILDEIKLEQKI